MRTLWRTTASLLRKYPILWLPVVLARLITFHLGWLDDTLRYKIGIRLLPLLAHTHAHSVLSGNITTDSPEPVVLRKIAALTAPIHFGRLFVGDFLFACALIAIAAMLRSLAITGRGTLRDAGAPISESVYRISIFCLKLLGLGLISGWITSYVAPFVGSFIDHNGPQKLLLLSHRSQMALGGSPIFIDFLYHLWILPITLCVVYVIAPIELHLLQPPDLPPAPNQRRQARLAEMTASVGISVLGLAAWTAQRSFFQLIVRTDQNTYLTSIAASLVKAIPYVPLYIAFYLIANPDSPLVTTPEAPLDLPSLPESPPPSISA
jgi:hypothetical protein